MRRWHTHADSNTRGSADPDGDTHADSNTRGSHADPDCNTHPDCDTHADCNTHAGCNTRGSHADPNGDTHADPNTSRRGGHPCALRAGNDHVCGPSGPVELRSDPQADLAINRSSYL
jgi:hypothetical protein